MTELVGGEDVETKRDGRPRPLTRSSAAEMDDRTYRDRTSETSRARPDGESGVGGTCGGGDGCVRSTRDEGELIKLLQREAEGGQLPSAYVRGQEIVLTFLHLVSTEIA